MLCKAENECRASTVNDVSKVATPMGSLEMLVACFFMPKIEKQVAKRVRDSDDVKRSSPKAVLSEESRPTRLWHC